MSNGFQRQLQMDVHLFSGIVQRIATSQEDLRENCQWRVLVDCAICCPKNSKLGAEKPARSAPASPCLLRSLSRLTAWGAAGLSKANVLDSQ